MTKGTGKSRRSDGGIYLVVADDSDEFGLALRYASRMASAHRGHVAVLYVIDVADFQHWNNVEEIIRTEMREKAEKELYAIAARVNEINGQFPSFYIREGNKADVLVDVINDDIGIRMLVLGGATQATGPGPLVSHFTGRGLSRLRVPVVVVPGHLEAVKIDAIA